MDKIPGVGVRNFQPRHLEVARRDTAESIKPNLFPEVDESVAMALLASDVINLSPEARELLKSLRKKQQGKVKAETDPTRLLYNLKDLQEDLEKDKKQDRNAAGARSRGLNMPPSFVFQLTGPEQDAHARQQRRSLTGDLIDRMIVYTPSRDPVARLKQDLDVLGEKMVETVRAFGVKIIILERQQPMGKIKLAGMLLVAPGERTFDGRDWNQVRGLYDQSRKIMVVGEETIGQRSHSAPRHEFAHAYDHTFTERHQRRLPLSVQLWNLFAERRRGLVTPYSATNPAEYFAESVEAFFQPALRAQLHELDPQMHEYLAALFAA